MTLRIAGLAFILIAAAATAQAQIGQDIAQFGKNAGHTIAQTGRNAGHAASNAGHGAEHAMSNAGHGAAHGLHKTFRNDHAHKQRHHD